MLNHPALRIDMTLTDEHILGKIRELIPETNGLITYERIADECRCHIRTVIRSTRRLKSAGRLEMDGGSGRKPVTYKVVKDA